MEQKRKLYHFWFKSYYLFFNKTETTPFEPLTSDLSLNRIRLNVLPKKTTTKLAGLSPH